MVPTVDEHLASFLFLIADENQGLKYRVIVSTPTQNKHRIEH